MTLREALPSDFLREFSETAAARLLDNEVISTHSMRWPGRHRNVYAWWTLSSGHRVGWNENPSRGWSFPVLPPA